MRLERRGIRSVFFKTQKERHRQWRLSTRKSFIHRREARAGIIFGGSLFSAKQCKFIRSESNRQYVTGSLDYQRFGVMEYHRTKHEFCQARNRTTTAIWRNRAKRQSRSSLARSVAAVVIKPRSPPSSKPHAHPDIMPHQAPFIDAAYSRELPMGVARIDDSVWSSTKRSSPN